MIRALLVLLCAIVLGLGLVGLRQGWRNRGRRQSGLGDLPPAPVDLGAALLPPQEGLYVGSAYATSWQDRVVHGGLGSRAAATASLHAEGVLIERQGAAAVFIPAADVIDARLAPGLAGKVVGAGGLLVVRWRLGGAELDTGFRADDKSSYPQWVTRINEWVAV